MMTDDEERELEQLRAKERRADWAYAGVLIFGLIVVVTVMVLVLSS
jgi:hypothetical protein